MRRSQSVMRLSIQGASLLWIKESSGRFFKRKHKDMKNWEPQRCEELPSPFCACYQIFSLLNSRLISNHIECETFRMLFFLFIISFWERSKNVIEKRENPKLHVKAMLNSSVLYAHAINKIPQTAFCIFVLVFSTQPPQRFQLFRLIYVL
jgi:hypothetical protein